ncbi:MAG TPA: hypothetical protein VGJ28_00075 [Micromonosporaceae bacterium]|jgi:hypothetical protein
MHYSPSQRARTRRALAVATAAALLLSAGACRSASSRNSTTTSSADYYKGKTITIVVPSAAGGGTDGTARAIAQYWGQFIPGHPTIIVKNVDGGGGSAGLREVASVDPKDGTTVAIMNIAAPLRYIFKASGYDFDLSSMEYVGALRNSPVIVMRTGAGANVTALQAHAKTTPVVVANSDAGGSGPLQANVGLHVLNVPDKMVFGFTGTGPIGLAMKRGDVDTTSVAYPGFTQTFQPLGNSYPLYQVGYTGADGSSIVRDTNGSEASVPTLDELYQSVYHSAPSGQYWDAYLKIVELDDLGFSFLTRQGTPPAALQALQTALVAMGKDATVVPKLAKLLGEAVEISPAADAAKLLQGIIETPPETVTLLKGLSGLKS